MTHTRTPSDSAHFSAPARVNLLGEHTDYTGGYVLPMAIPFFTRAVVARSRDGGNHFSSERFNETCDFAVDERPDPRGLWSDYPMGVLRALEERGIQIPPFELHLSGNVPLGSGLSSSASVEVASALAMLSLQNVELAPEHIAVLCRQAENKYVGSPCGIMDQFVVAAATAGHALLLNTRTLAFEHLPMNKGMLAETCVIICNSMVKHSIASGEYGVRHREVMEGQRALREAFPHITDLGEATLDQLNACRSDMSPQSFRRCRHIISENARVRDARQAMFAGDPVALGELMAASHASERDDFECSCEEIDFLAETASRLPGCYGARLTGGGFGGCTVNLVDKQYASTFVTELKRAYSEAFQINAETYKCEAVDGAVHSLVANTGGVPA